MNAVDTNVLLYAHDSRDPSKQNAALALLESLDQGVLLWQVACEYLNASRKLEPLGFDREQAWKEVSRLRLVWRTLYPGWDSLEKAQGLMKRYSLSFWDSMIVAACLMGKVQRLYTEDFDVYPHLEGLQITNPFRGL